MMRVFLTGGTGFIGQPLTGCLLRRGWQVSVLVRAPGSPQAQALHQMGARLVQGDVTERGSMRSGITGSDLVIHNAGYYEFGLNAEGRRRAQRINVDGTDNVLGLALELDIPRAVYVSTVWAFGRTERAPCDETFVRNTGYCSAYERTKSEAHAVALQHHQRGLPVITVCPNGVVGTNDHSVWGYFLRLYVNRLMPPMAWSPDSIFPLIEVHDLAEGIALAAEKGRPGETYFLCGEPKTLREHFSYWGGKPGGFKKRVWIPAWLAEIAFWPLGPFQRALGLPAFLSPETVRAGASSLNYSSDKARRELGWSYKLARDMWSEVIDGELELLERRRHQNLVSRLKPLASCP